MSVRGRLEVWWKWIGSPSADGADDRQLIQWRADYEEARAIARYFRWLAGRGGAAQSHGTQGRS